MPRLGPINPALAFRFRARANVVVRAVRRYGAGGLFRVLEVGAADGRTLIEIKERLGDGHFVGVEYDRGLLKSLPQLPNGVRLLQGDA